MSDPGVVPPMHKNYKATLPRIKNFYSSTAFEDVNLKGKLYPQSKEIALSYWAMPGGEGDWQKWSFQNIIFQTFEPTKVGLQMKGLWSTHWFKVEYEIPLEWMGKEVRLRWDTGSEAAVWSPQGDLLQGLSTGVSKQLRPDFIITDKYDGGQNVGTLYVEVAGSTMFGGSDGDRTDLISPPDTDRVFTLRRAEIAVMDRSIYKLIRDLEVLHGIAEQKREDSVGYSALFTANQMVNEIISGNYRAASELGDAHFAKGNGARAHTLAAIGNCHIDSAWLWPISETKRKVGRSFSSQIDLMKKFPDFVFVASQAQQWDWCKTYYPSLFNTLKDYVKTGQFLPVGATWTEMDGNIPSGESFIRQFFYGQKFYKKEFGYTCKEFWLPDTFGYSAHIPGLMKHVGLARFLTQKLSWSFVNKFPNHNFIWEGIDGTTVLAHFPPADSYEVDITPKEALHTVNNLEDKGRVSTSAFLFGYGDGGGGPTEDMLQRANRMKDVDGIPKVQLMSPDEMFSRLEKEKDNFAKWTGELYLELHNGTYTSQAAMKQLCRETEFKLRDVEFLLSSTVGIHGLSTSLELLTKSQKELEVAWKILLLNQFHDILPGSSITIVHQQAVETYKEALQKTDSVFVNSLQALFGSDYPRENVLLNTLQWPRREVIKMPSGNEEVDSGETKHEVLVEVPAFGYGSLKHISPSADVSVTESDGVFVLENGFLRAEISSMGQVVGLKVKGDDRDVFRSDLGTQFGGNRLVIYDDEPLYWDAWDIMDYHLETAKVMNAAKGNNPTQSGGMCTPSTARRGEIRTWYRKVKVDLSILKCKITEDQGLKPVSNYTVTPVTAVETGPVVGRVQWSLDISNSSTLHQVIEVRADCPYLIFDTFVEWQENRKLIKVLFDTNILSRSATFDVQFGNLQRPTHMNTSWDTARYEVCGHKWADLSEPDWGVSVLNDSKYGWMARGSSLALSLLRSPKAPDDTCDMRTHSFKYALMPHVGSIQENELNRRAYEFNNPLRTVEISSSFANLNVSYSPTWSAGSVEGSGVVLHTIKPTDDNSGDLILRMFEGNGCKSKAIINLRFPVKSVVMSNGMEEVGTNITFSENSGMTSIPVSLTPFQIMALRIAFK